MTWYRYHSLITEALIAEANRQWDDAAMDNAAGFLHYGMRPWR